MTAKVGTPIIMPPTPNIPPNNKMENNTQNGDNPVESPKILGPIIFPSNCCNRNTKITKYSPFIGSTIKINIAVGIAPINGPKYGITFVTPTNTLTKSAYGILNILTPIKHNIPIIAESIILPIINPLKIELLFLNICNVKFALFGVTSAYIVFLP